MDFIITAGEKNSSVRLAETGSRTPLRLAANGCGLSVSLPSKGEGGSDFLENSFIQQQGVGSGVAKPASAELSDSG